MFVMGALSLLAAPALALDPFFTEYVEGSSFNKAIEVYNPGPSAIDLSGYTILIYFNGSSTAGSTIALPVVMLAANDVWVVVNNQGVAGLLALGDQQSSSLNFNGDDAVVLRRNSDNAVMDAFGQIGFDPGTAWGSGMTSTVDHTLRRFQAPDPIGTDAFDPALQWEGFPIDTFNGLGLPESPVATESDTWGAVKALYN
jgi:predicted extracellular nuclease